MTSDYKTPDPALGDWVDRQNAESEADALRLENASPVELKAVIRDAGATQSSRMNALMFLRIQKDPEFLDVLLDLFDDLDQHLWHEIHPSKSMQQDSRFRQKYFEKLDGPDLENSAAAAVSLAIAGEVSLIPRLADWLNNGDEPHRNVAIEALRLLNSPDALAVLQQFWDEGKGDDDTRLCVAGALIQSGDPRGRSVLEATARRAQGVWSVIAATCVYVAGRCSKNPDDLHQQDGLKLMLHVLNEGDLDAKQGMVNQIWNFEHLPHAFTADGRDEAQAWVESQLESCILQQTGRSWR